MNGGVSIAAFVLSHLIDSGFIRVLKFYFKTNKQKANKQDCALNLEVLHFLKGVSKAGK